MIQTGHLPADEPWNKETVLQKLDKRFRSINFNQARQDILPFIKDPEAVNLWSQEFFTSITNDKLKIEV